MSITLRVFLIIGSIITLFYIQKKVRKMSLEIDEASYWIILFVVLVVMSLYPQLVSGLAHFFGFKSGSNFVFLLIIFLLLIKTFSMSNKVSSVEKKLKDLIQDDAIKDNEDRENK